MAEYREQQKHSSASDIESLKESKRSEDPETIPSDENTLLPTKSVEPEQILTRRPKAVSRYTMW